MIYVDNYLGQLATDGTQTDSRYGGGIVNDLENWSLRRPFYADKGRHAGKACVKLNTGKWTANKGERRAIYNEVPIRDLINSGRLDGAQMGIVLNATALRKEEWIELDRVVLRSARFRLTAWGDLAAANSFGGFNAMGKMMLEHETMSDPGEAVVSMTGITPGRRDAPQYQLEGLPLPITHCDFWFDSRTLGISRGSGTPLDTTMGEAAGRRVAESVEKVTIGVDTGLTYGGNSTQVGGYGRTSSVYGYLNYSARLTKTNLYKPTGVGRAGTGWVPADTLKDVLAMLDTLRLNKFSGPFMLYHSNDWDQYMDNDYILTGGNVATQTLRERLRRINGISDVKRLDFLAAETHTAYSSGLTDPAQIKTANPFTLLMVQMTPEVARAVNGMDITTVQWETVGGMQLNFKVMCIQVPQLRSDFYGNCGILDADVTTGV